MADQFVYPGSLKRQFMVSLVLFVLMFAAGCATIFYVFANYAEKDTLIFGLGVLFIALSAVMLIVGILGYRKAFKTYLIESRTRMLTSFYAVNSSMNIIISLFMTLEKMRVPGDEKFADVKYQVLRNSINKIKETILSFSHYEDMLKNPESVDEDLVDSGMKEINNHLFTLNEHIVSAMEDFANSYGDKSDTIKKTGFEMATLIYYLANIIPIISDFSSSSNRFSRTVIMQVIGQFEEIASFSTRITDGIQSTMSDLMNEGKEDSLAFIIKRAHSVVEDFDTFYKSMDSLKDVSNQFVHNSIEKLKNISDIADSIEEIAETIKVISLNVSIEAANTGNIGKGFHVLARDLRQFAHTTMRFAQDVKNRVQDTMMTTEKLKEGYVENMESVYRYGEEIKQSIESFETIIIKSFEKIRTIIDTLRSFSDKIDNGIKEVVGKLQYYDITSQEVEHLSQFIEQIFRISSTRIDEIHIDHILDQDTRQIIKVQILDTVNKIITTKNEREIYETYQKVFGVRVNQIDIENKLVISEEPGGIEGEILPSSKADDIIIF